VGFTPLAQGAQGYRVDAGAEAYIAASPGLTDAAAGCRFPAGDVYALRLGVTPPGATRVTRAGRVGKIADVPGVSGLSAIAFDSVGQFQHRLLVLGPTSVPVSSGVMTLAAVDCNGRVQTIASRVPRAEGGVAVAPLGFGRYGGDLIVPDELSGKIWAIAPDGASRLVASSGVPSGGDIGVESEGFVPPRFIETSSAAFLADRGTAGNPHAGDDTLLTLSAAALRNAGVVDGDLLVATEAGGTTIDVRCSSSCSVRRVASGPAPGHIEGHIAFLVGS
jgi:hypothetical protein